MNEALGTAPIEQTHTSGSQMRTTPGAFESDKGTLCITEAIKG